MTDQHTLLRQMADRADPAALPSPEAVRAAGTRRARRAGATWAAAGALVIGGTVGLLANVDEGRPRPAPGPPVATPTSTPSAVAEPEPPVGWDRAEIAPGEEGLGANALAVRDGRFVAAVDTSISKALHGTDLPPLWWSDDGRDWHPAEAGPSFPNAWDVAASDEVFVALTPQGPHRTSAWWSADGASWQRAETPEGFQVFSVSSTAAGLFAWSEEQVHTSGDGRVWTASPDLPATATRVCFIHDLGDEVVLGAVDARERPLAWSRRAGAWRPAEADRPALGRWCRVHETVAWTAEGPDTAISILPYHDDDNTIFVQDR